MNDLAAPAITSRGNAITAQEIAAWQQARVERVVAKIKAACAEDNCEVTGRPIYTDDGRTIVEVRVVAK